MLKSDKRFGIGTRGRAGRGGLGRAACLRRRRPLAAPTAALAAALFAAPVAAQDALTVVSYGGAYSYSQIKAYHEPFTAKTGIRIHAEDYNGGLAEIQVQVQSGNITWDVVDMPLARVVRGCDEGLLEPVDIASFPPAPDGTPAEKDFLPETLQSECGIPLIVWSTVFAYDESRFPGDKPASLEDFFDLEKFPGKRALRRSPRSTLEFALMADGVPVDKVYQTLATDEGLRRVFAKLDTIKEHVVWWTAGSQPPLMLADGEVVMATSYNGRIFNAWNKEKKPFKIVWDRQVWTKNFYTIVKGTPRYKQALEFVQFASDTQRLADQARYISYGPARHSAMAMISTHAETGADMAPHMPTTPEHFRHVLESDFEWWADYGDEMTERFSTWLAR